jgi:hypothetical protein
MFFAIPFLFLQLGSNLNYFAILLFPLAFLQNFVFTFSNRNSHVHGSIQKREFVAKFVDYFPFLKSDLPSYLLAVLFSIYALGLILYALRSIYLKRLII